VSIDQLAREIGIIGEPKIIKETKSVEFLDWLLQATLNQPVMQKYLSVSRSPLQYTWPIGDLQFSLPVQ
ncbi:MAG TPA: hypothetical protein QF772_12470, partial [Nitrospinaceae bacterium]|nr:hypothetical protein [Nitrospinaceae bacterium]